LLSLKNITTVVITGYIPFAEKTDVVIWMDHGKILHMGSPSDVFKKLNNA
jgi:ABC-type polar amino acid transport system ATPase subunit